MELNDLLDVRELVRPDPVAALGIALAGLQSLPGVNAAVVASKAGLVIAGRSSNSTDAQSVAALGTIVMKGASLAGAGLRVGSANEILVDWGPQKLFGAKLSDGFLFVLMTDEADFLSLLPEFYVARELLNASLTQIGA